MKDSTVTIIRDTFLTLFLLFAILQGFAQTGAIKGKLIDNEKKSPIIYASVTLMNAKDTSLIKGTMSEKDGSFVLDEVSNGKYIVKAYFLGYTEWYSQVITIGGERNIAQLGEILLSVSPQMLAGAEIVYVRPMFEQKAGKTVMNVESMPTAGGDNVIELLRKMPGVTVDQNDKISIQGKSGALILIDDRDPHLAGDDLINYLKSMPSSTIDKIEIIKNPSARYDAAGTAGIINIVTKKDNNKGINGSIWAGGNYSGTWQSNQGVNLNAKLNKWVLSGSYYYLYYTGKTGGTAENITFFDGNTTRITSNENKNEIWGNKGNFQMHGFNLGADYYIDAKNSLGVSYRGSLSKGKWNSIIYNRFYFNDVLQQTYKNVGHTDNNDGNHTVNFNYKHSFDSIGKSLYLDVTYSMNDAQSETRRDLQYYTDNFITFNKDLSYNDYSDPNRMQVVTAKLDYEHPINDKIRYECGLKTSFVSNNNNSFNYMNDSLIESKSNHFKYTESISAAYVLANFSVADDVSIQAGLRSEFTYLNGFLITTGETNKQNYIDLFPSLQVDYTLPKSNTLSFNYRSRIYRPDYYSLNPYVSIEDEYNISTGNPKLKPEYQHNFSIEHSWKYMIFSSLSYQYAQGSSTQMLFTDKITNLKTSRPENIGKSHTVSASIYARIPIGKWWVMAYSVSGNCGKEIFDYESKKEVSDIWSFQFYTNHTFTFLKNYALEIAAWGTPQSSQTFGMTPSRLYIWAGIKGSFFKQKLTVKLGVNDLLNNNKWKEQNTYPDSSIANGTWYWNSRGVTLNISYNFGKQNIQPRQRKSGDSEELDRMGGGGNQGSGKGQQQN